MKHVVQHSQSPRYTMDKVIGTSNTFYPILGRADCMLDAILYNLAIDKEKGGDRNLLWHL
jgi:hypothetical protein